MLLELRKLMTSPGETLPFEKFTSIQQKIQVKWGNKQ